MSVRAIVTCVDQIIKNMKCDVPNDGSASMRTVAMRVSMWLMKKNDSTGENMYGKNAAEAFMGG